MKMWLVLVFCAAAAACAGNKWMTYSDYQSIPIGEDVATLQCKEGRPYQINDLGNGYQEYVYIERVPIGSKRELFREYILVISPDNVVVEKKLREESTPRVNIEIDH